MKQLFSRITMVFLALLPFAGLAQLDTKHYVPPMFGREDLGTHYIVLSTPEAIPFDVTITDGSGTLITTETISSAASSSYTLGAGTATPFLVTEAELNTALTGKGLVLEADKPFFVNIRVVAGPQAGSLTSKGVKAALGKEFRTGHLFNNTGDSFRKSSTFSIMATEDGTTVTIDDIRPGVIFRGTTPSGAPLTSPSVTVTLNEGETYVVAAYMDEASATENVNGINGTRITSDKDIVVNTGQWLGGNALVGGTPAAGRDLGIDQIVPVDKIGNEYVVIKGEGIDNEKVIVVATQDGTDIMLDGVVAPVATIDAGDYYVIDGTAFSANDNLFIQTSEDVYVYQSANGGDGATDDNERQVGLNFLPPIGCSGSKSVNLPEVDFIGTAYINIIANTGATVVVDGVPLGAGDAVTGTGDYVTYKLTSGYSGDITITSDDLIRVALINLSGNIGAAGYFSGFTKDVSVLTETVLADGIALEGCIPATFTFGIDGASATDTEITYTIGGTATNGIDYSYIDSSLIIPAGSTEATIIVNAIADGFPEGPETVFIIYQPDACSELDTAVLTINDAVPIEFELDGTDLSCFEDFSGEIDIPTTGGTAPYTYEVTTDAGAGTTTTYTSMPITGLPAGEYSVAVFDAYGCTADALVIGGIFDADTTFLPDGTGDTYTTTIDISGFGAGETLDDMSQLQQICMTMEHSYMGDLEMKIIAPSGEEVILKQYPGGGSTDLGEPFAAAPVDGASSTLTDPGVGFEYCFNDMPIFGTMVDESGTYTHTIPSSTGGTYTDTYLPSGSYESFENLDGLLGATLDGTWTLEVTDNLALDNGYIFTWNISLISDLPDTLVTLHEPDEIVIDGFVTEATCGVANGSINISASGAFPPYTYLWSNGETTEDITGLDAGSYTVYVTDDNGCTDSSTFIVNNTSSINITTTVVNASCVGSSDGSIDVVTSGGTPPYTFSWSSGETTEDLSSLEAGAYTITVTDDEGCIYSEEIIVNSLPPIVISLVSLDNEECGTGNGAIDISVTGGTGSYGYSWSSGATTEDISGLSSGDYTITVTDASGCTADETYSLINDVSACSEFCFLDADAVVTNEECGNGAGALDVTITDVAFPYTVVWSSGETTEDISGLSAGDYTITINDADGCEHIETFTVANETYSLDLSAFSVVNENCGNADGSIDITVVGGSMPYSYSWSSGETTEDISALSAGDYEVTITDASGCELTTSFTVENNVGTLEVSEVISNEVCGGGNGSINITVSGGTAPYTYLWSSGETTQDISGLSAGTYSCTITDATGCTFTTDDYTVIDGAGTLNIFAIANENEQCDNNLGFIDISVTGGSAPYDFLWSSGETTEDIAGLSEGTYSCTITDDIGCVLTTGDIIIYNDGGDLEVTTDLVNDEICGNGEGSIFVATTGGTAPFTYDWSDGSTSEDNTNLTAGDYTLIVTDAVGCENGVTETVNNTAGTLAIEGAITIDEICGNGAGSIDVTISGGTAPIVYSWDSGETTEDLSSLSAGTYVITVTDANGCEATESYTITNDAGDLAVSSALTAEICSGANGAIDVTVTGGSTPYTFAWSSGATTEDLTGLSAGIYSSVITDNAGCSVSTGDLSIVNNPGTMTSSTVVGDETCGDGSGAIDLTITDGTAPITYLWSTGATTEDISGLSAGIYTYTATDASGCVISEDITIINNSGTLSIDDISITNESCDDDAGAIDVTISGGTAPLVYAWSSGETTEDITGLSEGDFDLTVTDASGCSVSTGTITVDNDPGTLTVTEVIVVDENCGNGVGSVDITVGGGVAPLSYLWSNGATTEDINLLSEGTYTCTITDAAGCSIDVLATVLNDAGDLSLFSSTVTDETCGDGSGAIDITIAGGTTPYSYAWAHGPTSEDLIGLSSGNYTVFVTDASGCSTSADFTLDNSGGDLAISSFTMSEENCGDASGALDITFTGGESPYTFSWDNGATTEDISGLEAGDYELTITDINGCSITQIFTVTENVGDLALVSAVVTDEACGDGAGAIDITFTGGDAPFVFDWDSGETTEDISGLSEGDYTLVITDAFGCEITTTETVVNISGGFDASFASVTDETCGDAAGSIDVDVVGGTPPYTYSWSSGETTEDLSGLSAGDYELTVTDAVGCVLTISTTVNNNTGTLALTGATVEDEDCADGTGFIDITITGGATPYTYLWSTGAITEDISGLSEGTYTCVITDNAGCVLNYSGDVGNSGGGITTDVVITPDQCGAGNGSILVTATGGINPYDFSWTGGTPTTCCTWTLEMFDSSTSWNTATVDVIIDGVSIGEFTVTGGGYNLETFEICDGSSLELVWNPGFFDDEVSFDLYDADGVLVFSQGPSPTPGTLFTTTATCPGAGPTSTILTGLTAGDYELTITDDVGCSITETYTVEPLESDIVITVVDVTDETCGNNNGVIEYTLSGGTAPFVTTANGFTDGPPVGLLENLYADTWEIITVDDNGCTDTLDVIVDNIATFTTTAVLTNDFCSGGIGAIDITVTGESGTLDFDWDSGETTEDLTGLTAGTYTVTITDNVFGPGDCEDEVEFTIIDTTDVLLSATSIDDLCSGGTGSIDLSLDDETDVTILWSTGETTEDISGLSEGTYSVTVTSNVTGCEETLDIEIFNASDFTFLTAVTDDVCNDSIGAIDLTIIGGTDMVFEWSNGETTEDLTDIPEGTYKVIMTNNTTGCVDSTEVTVGNSTSGIDGTIVVTDEYCDGDNGALDLTVTGAIGTPSFEWSTGEMTEDISGLTSGDYSVIITDDADGCQAIVFATVDSLNTDLAGSIVATDELCGDGTGALDLTVTDAIGTLTYDWSTGETTEDISGLNAGTYSVTVTDDAYGCQITLDGVVNNETTFEAVLVDVVDAICATCPTGSIDITINEFVGDGPYTFDWSNGETTEDISDLVPGIYEVVVTSASGCTDTLEIEVGNSQSVGIYDLPEWELNLYPNPSLNDFTLDYNFNSNEPVLMTMVDLSGKTVYVTTLEDVEGKIQVGTSHLEGGVYYIRFQSKDEQQILKFTLVR
ncbi:MAG: T9SS type A sorting domain-containing protein [Crocinitomicaceae bacterium]|nr:T9SS type A sorting domain-containing protein [Crocinitomicaceae bacterium]